jgi:general secretion pathway protein L
MAALLSRAALAPGEPVRRFLAWWLGELREMAQPWLLRLLARRTEPTTILEAAPGHFVLRAADRARLNPVAIAADRAGEEALAARLRAVVRSRNLDARVAIRLDRAMVFETDLTLPLAAAPSLRAILQHQIERLVPLPAREACFAFRVAAQGPSAKLLQVHLVVAKHATIERLLALARSAGLRPRVVLAPAPDAVAGAAACGPEAIGLWHAERRGTETRSHRRICRALEAAIVLFVVIAFPVHLYRLDRMRDALQAELAAARRQAAAAQDLARQVREVGDTLAFFAARREAAAPLKILEQLTRLVPLDSWVTEFSLHGRTVEIAGFAPRATDLIALLAHAPQFEQPQFRAPVTLAPDGKGEQFSLSFLVRVEAPR